MKEPLSFEFRGWFLLAAWGIAALAIVFPEVYLLIAFPLFPLGLFDAVRGKDDPAIHSVWPVALLWLAYLAISLTAWFSKKWFVFVILYAVLVWMLINNVRGCQHILANTKIA